MKDKSMTITPAFVLGLDKVLDEVSKGYQAKVGLIQIDYRGISIDGETEQFIITRKLVD